MHWYIIYTDSVALPVEIKYQSVPSVSPKYKILKLPLNNLPSGNVGTLVGAATQPLEWMLGPNVYNLAQSYITYNAQVNKMAAKFGVLFVDTQTIADQITFSDAAGNNLLQLNNADKYVKIMRKANMPLEEFLTHTLTDPLAPSYLPASGASALLANLQPVSFATNAAGNMTTLLYPNALAAAAYTGDFVNATGPRQVLASTAQNTDLNVTFRIPLSAFVDTILAEDKDLYFGQNMYLRITPPSADRMTVATDDVLAGTFANPVSNTAGITITNCYLNLAVEQSTVIRDSIIDKFNKGQFEIPLQVIYPYRISVPQSTQQNVVWNLTRDMGRKLKWIAHTVWANGDTLANSFNCINYNGVKIASYQTFLNSQPLQNQALSCLQPSTAGVQGLDDYYNNLPFMEGSVIQNAGMYQANWFHKDNFCRTDVPDEISVENLDDGLDMGQYQQQLQWSLQATTANVALTHISFACFKRRLAVRPEGLSWIE